MKWNTNGIIYTHLNYRYRDKGKFFAITLNKKEIKTLHNIIFNYVRSTHRKKTLEGIL